MLARPAERPFDSDEHLFEPSWGGRRALAFLEPAVETDATASGGRPTVRRASGSSTPADGTLAGRLTELGALSLRVEARSAVLDGELVVVDAAGRPDAAGLEARLAGARGCRRGLPRRSTSSTSTARRSSAGRSPAAARRCGGSSDPGRGRRRAGDPGEGRALYEAVTAQGLAGVLARQRDSPYLPGIRSRLWRSIAAAPRRRGPEGRPRPSARDPDRGCRAAEPQPGAAGPPDPSVERPLGPRSGPRRSSRRRAARSRGRLDPHRDLAVARG